MFGIDLSGHARFMQAQHASPTQLARFCRVLLSAHSTTRVVSSTLAHPSSNHNQHWSSQHASFSVDKSELTQLNTSLNEYMDWLDDKIEIPKDMSSTELLDTRMVADNGHTSLHIEEELPTLLKAYGVGYDFGVRYNHSKPFDIQKASSSARVHWLGDAWDVFGFIVVRTILNSNT
jgi:hypothetical protein